MMLTGLEVYLQVQLNSNIRCIEICLNRWSRQREIKLNSNIRCIEILTGDFKGAWDGMLNSNIRCIEISVAVL